MEKGDVRLWLQLEKLSPAADLDMILNDKVIQNTPVLCLLQMCRIIKECINNHYKQNCKFSQFNCLSFSFSYIFC